MSLTPRHSFGVRSRVQTTIEMTSTTRPALNHGERKTENSESRSISVDHGRAEDRVVAGVGRLERRRVVRRGPEGEIGELLDGHPDDREQQQEDDLEDREIDRREQVPQPVARLGRGCCGRTVGFGPSSTTAGLAMARTPRRRRAPGRAARRASSRPQPGPPRSPPAGPRGPRARPRRGAGPGVMPAASSSASVDWRCEVDGGWTTIVWTLPSEAVSSGSCHARR